MNKSIIVVFLTLICSISMAQKSNCPDFDGFIQQAQSLLQTEKYVLALKKLTAAREYCPYRAKEIDEEINKVVLAIELKKDQANLASEKAKQMQLLAFKRAIELEITLNALKEARKNESLALKEKNELFQKAELLEKDLSDDNVYEFLLNKADGFLKVNQNKSTRDYQNALTYYSLAAFLKSDTLVRMLINACKLGVMAEREFYDGNIVQAKKYFEEVFSYATNREITGRLDSTYELNKLSQIDEVQRLLTFFDSTKMILDNTLTLEGEWWTIPEAILKKNNIQEIVFERNPNLENIFKYADFSNFDLKKIIISESLVNTLDTWRSMKNIQYLKIINNERLLHIDSLFVLNDLRCLIIENNDILNYIGDVKCPSLEEFMVKGNNRLHSVQVENSKTLKKLVLRDLLSQDDVSLNDLDLPSLIELELSNLPLISEAPCIVNSINISKITVQGNNNLKSIENLFVHKGMDSLILSNNRNLSSIAFKEKFHDLKYLKVKAIPYLVKERTYSKLHLRGIKNLPNLETLDIRTNSYQFSFSSLAALKSLKQVLISRNLRHSKFSIDVLVGYGDTHRKSGQIQSHLTSSIFLNYKLFNSKLSSIYSGFTTFKTLNNNEFGSSSTYFAMGLGSALGRVVSYKLGFLFPLYTTSLWPKSGRLDLGMIYHLTGGSNILFVYPRLISLPKGSSIWSLSLGYKYNVGYKKIMIKD